jgi:anti-anti-sigma factor
VLHAAHEGVHVLRFLGEIRYPLVPSVNRYVDHLLIREVPSAFVIDLTETSAIDSTSLGALGRIANRMREVGGPRVTLLSTRPDINEVLISSAFDQVFDLVPESALAGGEGQELPIEEADREGLRRTVLEAHRVLMALSERNRGLFRDLVAALEAEGGKDPSCP